MFCFPTVHALATLLNKLFSSSLMTFLPITALSAWVMCPMSFYRSYVLRVKPVLNRAMALGLAKHKVFELWPGIEAKIASDLREGVDVSEVFQQQVVPFAQMVVRNQSRTLKSADVLLTEAFQHVLDVSKFAASQSVSRLQPFLSRGVYGEELWQALSPKFKTEYSVKSDLLRIKGRIDVLECYGNRLVPVELKSGKVPVDGTFDHHRIQAASYAVILEEMFQTVVSEAVVHYIDGNSRRSVFINPYMRSEVAGVAEKARACLESGEIPKGCGRDYCDACNAVKSQ